MAGLPLWRQRLDSTIAVQLTDGPGYDYQPDWSPDGRSIVYASYHHDALELRLLDLASVKSRPADAAAARPRRAALVARRYADRLRLDRLQPAGSTFSAATVTADGLGSVPRVTGENQSPLPR